MGNGRKILILLLFTVLFLSLSSSNLSGQKNNKVSKRQLQQINLHLNNFREKSFVMEFDLRYVDEINGEKNLKKLSKLRKSAFNQAKRLGSKQLSHSVEWVFRNKKIGEKIGKFFSGYFRKIFSFVKDGSISLRPMNIHDYATGFAMNEANFSMRETLKWKNKKGINGFGAQIYNGLLNSFGLYIEDKKVKFGGRRVKVPVRVPLGKKCKIGGNFDYNTQNKRMGLGCSLKLSKVGEIRVRTKDVKDPYDNSTLTVNSKPYKDTNITLNIGIRRRKPSGGLTINSSF